LSVDEGLRQRLEADGKRYERGRDETARAADYGRWASLGDEALALARRLAEQP
ncbi:MAG: hypothetical protein HUU35_13810, partial [Armatimonadetes bacterium]|nr:hypothetical protein [Armatimonadota bacterium]